jgi:FtsZ-binding cell division protein ZapB
MTKDQLLELHITQLKEKKKVLTQKLKATEKLREAMIR